MFWFNWYILWLNTHMDNLHLMKAAEEVINFTHVYDFMDEAK